MAKFYTRELLLLSLLIVYLSWDGTVKGAPPLTAKVQYKSEYTSRRGRGDGRLHLCNRPLEQDEIFSNCRAKGTSPYFPANVAECDCVPCMKTMELFCGKDRKWYPERSGLCDKTTGCGICDKDQFSGEMFCDRNQWDGYRFEQRTCKCLTNCRQVALKCMSTSRGNGGIWVPTVSINLCKAPGKFTEQTQKHQNAEYFNNTVTFTCDYGYELHGGVATHKCVNGTIAGNMPRCVPRMDTEEVHNTTTTENPDDTTDQDSDDDYD